MKKYDVTALGEVLIDFASLSVDEAGYPAMQAHPGGAPANFLAALTKFGCKTAFIGKVGTDAFGNMLKATLDDCGISTEGLISTEDYFTTLAFVTFDASGDRSFSFSRKPGADTQITFDEMNLSIIENSKVFHFGTLSLTDDPAKTATKKAVAYAKEKGCMITYDPNLRLPLWKDPEAAKEAILWGLEQADVVKISDEEVEFLWGISPEEGAEKLLKDFGIKLALVTCGAKGCVYKNKQASGMVASLNGIKVIDTTGAGDIFGGSAVSQLLKTNKAPEDLTDDELNKIVRFACTSAGLSTTRPGGIGSVPELSEVEALL